MFSNKSTAEFFYATQILIGNVEFKLSIAWKRKKKWFAVCTMKALWKSLKLRGKLEAERRWYELTL